MTNDCVLVGVLVSAVSRTWVYPVASNVHVPIAVMDVEVVTVEDETIFRVHVAQVIPS